MVLNKKQKGNTLPEILIAIVIISFTSTLGIVIFLNIQQSEQSFNKLKANEIALQILKESELQHNYIDQTFKQNEFTITKTIKNNTMYPDCIVLKVTVLNNQHNSLVEYQKLMHAN